MKELIKCTFCGKEYSNMGIGSHIWRMHGEGVNHDSKTKNNIPWNKGLTKENNESLKNISEHLKNKIKNGEFIPHSTLNYKHTDETRQKMSIARSSRTTNIGRGKYGWYKGYWCDSTWELAFVIYNLDHDIKFERNKEGFEYVYNGELHRFYPDFILEDGNYVEIKGYMNDKDPEKLKQFKHPLKLIRNTEIKPYIDYVTETYNVKLYEMEFLYDDKIIELQKKKEIYEFEKNERKIIRLEKRNKTIEERKNIIRNINDIDYSKSGWGNKISKVLGLSPQKTVKFIKEYMLDELKPFFNNK